MIKVILHWMFFRIFGLLDTAMFVKAMIRKCKGKGRVGCPRYNVGFDKIIWERMVEVHYEREKAPNWVNSRLFFGQEQGKNYGEYWLGIRCECMAPIIPIPFCAYEVVIKMGTDTTLFNDLLEKYYYGFEIYNHRSEFAHQIIEEATFAFTDTDIMYKEDPIWSTYD